MSKNKRSDSQSEKLAGEIKKKSELKKSIKEAGTKVRKVWKKTGKYGTALLIIIPMLLSIFLRIQPAYLPITDNWAQRNVESYYKAQISQKINQLYPNLPDANKNALIQSEFEKVKTEQKQQMDQQVKELSQQFKSKFQDGNGQTYLLAIDPYLFYRHTKNYVRYGHPGEVFKNGKSYDLLRDGRFLREQAPEFHSWLMSKLHKVISIFKPGISVMGSVFYFPIILCTLAVIPAFFIARKIGGNFGGFFAAVVTAIHPAVLSRTAGGFSDTDSYNLFFPLLITWLFVEALDKKKTGKTSVLAALSGFFIGVYHLAWGGWWYVYDFILAAGAAYIAIIVATNQNLGKIKEELKNGGKLRGILLSTGVLFISASVSIVLLQTLFEKNTFGNAIQVLLQFATAPLGFVKYKAVAVRDIWPNVLTTVAELNLASPGKVIQQMGGKLFYILAAISLVAINFRREEEYNKLFKYALAATVWLMIVMWIKSSLHWAAFLLLTLLPAIATIIIESRREVKTEAKYALIVIIWFAATFYAAMRGMRFSALIVPGLAVALGSGLGVIYHAVSYQMEKSLELKRTLGKIVVGALILFILVNPIRGAYNTAKGEIPSMNDAWYNTLKDIERDDADGIITSWWDFGHWFTAIAERKVTFDGGNQGRRIHWVGKTLLSNDEEEAVAILRMLNCGQDKGANLAEKYLKDQLKAYTMIIENVRNSREEAKENYIKYGLSDSEANKIINLTHCNDLLPQYYIASDDMVGKSGVWAHFGIWNFTRGAMWNKVHDKNRDEGITILTGEFGLDKETAERYYYEITTTPADKWVSPWPSYASSIGKCDAREEELICANGLKVNMKTGEAQVQTQQGTGSPASLVYVNSEGEFREKRYDKPIIPYSAALFSKEGRTYSVFMDPKLAKSMFTRMFFFEGKGLKYFKMISHRKQVTGGDIYVYKVDWDRYLKGDGHDQNKTITEGENDTAG